MTKHQKHKFGRYKVKCRRCGGFFRAKKTSAKYCRKCLKIIYP